MDCEWWDAWLNTCNMPKRKYGGFNMIKEKKTCKKKKKKKHGVDELRRSFAP